MAPRFTTAAVTFRFPCHLLEDKYGAGNYDDATDHIYNILTSIVPAPEHLTTAVDIDSQHANPWFHTLNLTIKGMQPFELQAFETQLRIQGLEPVDPTSANGYIRHK